jgi:hypothetical protein
MRSSSPAGHADRLVDRSGDHRANPVIPPSPTLLMPSGLSGLGASSVTNTSTGGVSRTVERMPSFRNSTPIRRTDSSCLCPLAPFVTMRVGVLIGEVCYNLRSALDYLVFALAELDSGIKQAKWHAISDRRHAKGFRVED